MTDNNTRVTQSLFNSAGIKVDNNDDLKSERDKMTPEQIKEQITARRIAVNKAIADSEAMRELAVKIGLVPKAYRNASFSKDKIKDNVTKMQNASGHKFKVINFDSYTSLCDKIINTIACGTRLDRSYLIGAPNGFGKQSFAIDCIVNSLCNQWNCAPYLSLTEIAQIKIENDKQLARGLLGTEHVMASQPFRRNTGSFDSSDEAVEPYYTATGNPYTDVKQPLITEKAYSWDEITEADVLVCFFSGLEGILIESQILQTLLNIRSAKGLPTIAMISTALTRYKTDPVLGRYIWKEILAIGDDDRDFGRLTYVSTYKMYELRDAGGYSGGVK